MEWFWETLGIESTTKVAEIKKAYVNEVRRLKNKETKEEVSQADYDKLAEAEKAAILFIEDQHNQRPTADYRSGYGDQSERLLEEKKQELTINQELVNTADTADFQIEQPAEAINEKPAEAKPVVVLKETIKKVKNTSPEMTPVNPIDNGQRSGSEVNEIRKRNQGRQATLKQRATQPKSKEPNAPKMKPKDVKEKSAEITQALGKVTEKAAVPSRTLADIRELLADWPRKIILKEWETCFRYRRQWSKDEFVELRENFLPLLNDQLVYLPKAILWYLYEELDLVTYELTSQFSWFLAIDDLPDFSFEQALYLPEEEAADYFDRRLHLYCVIRQEDWHSRTFEIDGLLAYFYSEEDWQAEYQIVDQDVENLAALYQIKRGIEKLVHSNEPPAIANHLLPPNIPLNKVDNQTAKFLRIIFNSLKEKNISLEGSLFIEDPQNNYLEDNLRELLVGLVFYRTNDQIKATKHFNNLTNDYQGLVKGLKNSAGFKGRATSAYVGQGTKHKADWRMILRVVVIGVIGLSLLGNVFSNNDDYEYSDDTDYYDEESESDEEWMDPEDPGYAFLTYFVEATDHRDDIETQRETYIETWVSSDLTGIFEEHLADSDPDASYTYEIVYKEIDDNRAHYLITQDEEPYLIVELTNWELVTAVVGKGWQEVESKTFGELVDKIRFTGKDIVENVVVGYFLLPVDAREEEFYYIMDYITDEAYNRLEWDNSIVDGLDFEKGTYQVSETLDGQPALLVNDSQDELSLVLLLDPYGRVDEVIEISYDDYSAAELKHLAEQADKKQSLPRPDSVSL